MTAAEFLRTFPVAIIGMDDETADATAMLHWTARDPAAVMFGVEDPSDGVTVEWLIARSILATALMPSHEGVRVGLCDVAVKVIGATLGIRLRTREGKARIFAHRSIFAEFLTETAAIIPSHSERECEAITRHLDAELRELVAKGDAP